IGERIEYAPRFADDLGTNAVTGYDGERMSCHVATLIESAGRTVGAYAAPLSSGRSVVVGAVGVAVAAILHTGGRRGRIGLVAQVAGSPFRVHVIHCVLLRDRSGYSESPATRAR